MITALDRLGSITDWRSGVVHSADRIRDRAWRVAAMLRSRGAGPGRNVALVHGGSAAFFADLLAIWQTGACAVCLNANAGKDERARLLEFADPVVTLAEETGEAAGEPSVAGPPANAPDDDALILFTSGTTGAPKGVVHSFHSIGSRIVLNQAHIPESAMRRTLCVLPTHFGHGLIGNCLTPLLAGHDLVLAPAANLEVTANLGAIVDEYGITFMSSVPALWKRAQKSAPPPRRGSLQRVHIGSAPLAADLWSAVAEWCGTRDVVNMYGITETANWIAGASLREHTAEDGLIGRMWGGKAAVRTASGEVCSEGEGELLVQSPSTMKGYYCRPDATAAVMHDGWFCTGDVGRIGADGVIRLSGRGRHEINRGGIKVYPEDIDLLLERHEAVREACAFAIPDDVEGQTIGVAVSLHGGANVNAQQLRRWCAERISREKVPVKWVIVDDIPKTDRGKMNRADVAAHCLALEPIS